MMEQHSLRASERAAVIAHYERAAGPVAANFPRAPFVRIHFPHGLDADPEYHERIYDVHALPSTIPTIAFGELDALHRYAAIDADALLWFVREGAVDFCSIPIFACA